MTKTQLLIAALALGFASAGIASVLLFRQAMTFYKREAETRLSPIDFRYQDENAELLAKPKSKPRIIIFGESRCGMWRPHHPTNWGDVEIVNRGIGGETTAQIRSRMEADVIALNPDVVILQMGDNDLKTMAVLPRRKKQIIAEAEANIRHIARSLADRGIQVIITTIFPPGPVGLLRKPIWSSDVNEAIDEVNRRLLELREPGIIVADCDAILRKGKLINPIYSRGDTLHLSAAGYEALNRGLEPLVKTALAR